MFEIIYLILFSIFSTKNSVSRETKKNNLSILKCVSRETL